MPSPKALLRPGDTPWQIVHRHEFQGAVEALRDGDVLRALGGLNFQFSASTTVSTQCRARLYLLDGTSQAYAEGQNFDIDSAAIRGFSPITLREISVDMPSASLPTFAGIRVNGVDGSTADANLVEVMNCDKVNEPSLLIPAGFSGMTTETFRTSDLIFKNGFDHF